MATSEQSRQKKLARRKAKTQKVSRERAQRKQQLASLAGRMRLASRHPIVFCKVASSLLSPPGLGSVVLCRQAPDGQLAVGFFLIDAGCLGIKDVVGLLIDRTTLLKQLSKHEYISTTPEDGLAMIEQAVAFADRLGFSPHPDFAKVLPLFGDVDSSLSDKAYQFGGPDGKPLYIAGPFEDEARQIAILNQLSRVAGQENFHFICEVPADQDSEAFFETEEDTYDDLLVAEAKHIVSIQQ